jgi:hypothetical protein
VRPARGDWRRARDGERHGGPMRRRVARAASRGFGTSGSSPPSARSPRRCTHGRPGPAAGPAAQSATAVGGAAAAMRHAVRGPGGLLGPGRAGPARRPACWPRRGVGPARGAGAAEQEPRSRCRGAGAAEQEPRSRSRGAGAAEQEPRSRSRGAGAAEQEPRSRSRGAGAAEQEPRSRSRRAGAAELEWVAPAPAAWAAGCGDGGLFPPWPGPAAAQPGRHRTRPRGRARWRRWRRGSTA